MSIMDQAEAAELQDEDRFPRAVLEHIMTLFDELSTRYQTHHGTFWDGWWAMIERKVPAVRWRKVDRRTSERMDKEIPILDEDMLESHLQEIREDVVSWVDARLQQTVQKEMLQYEESMAWMTGVCGA